MLTLKTPKTFFCTVNSRISNVTNYGMIAPNYSPFLAYGPLWVTLAQCDFMKFAINKKLSKFTILQKFKNTKTNYFINW